MIRAYGVSAWSQSMTNRAIARRQTHPHYGEGAHSLLTWQTRCDFGPLECGGTCCLAPGHIGAHECASSYPGEPDSCPA